MQQRIIDAHAHIFPEKIVRKAVVSIGDFYDIPMDGVGSSEDLLRSGGMIGVEKYIVHSVATKPSQVVSINSFIAQQMRLHPEFIGFATLHPYMDDLQAEVERAEQLGLRGIKLHPDFQAFHIDEPRAMALYRAIEGKLPLQIHMGDETRDFSEPVRLARVLDKFPDLTVIAAHFGGFSVWEDAKEYLVGRDVYFDTSSSLFKLPAQEAEQIMHDHGMEKMLFGTDYPMWLHRQELERFMQLRLTEQQRRMVLYDNAAKLLGVAD
ncbi:MAG: amidohydrolase family protein [Christensenellales bacterium]|jgi:predicted TIM-barrel fold metal-dependent hydrolase